MNRGEPWAGRDRVRDMAAGFFKDVPDLALSCDDVRVSGHHVLFLWTFVGHDTGTGKPLKVQGWEDWDLNTEGLVQTSYGWFDADAYARQVSGLKPPLRRSECRLTPASHIKPLRSQAP